MEHKTEVSSEPEQTETPRLPIKVINLVGPDSYANPCAPPDTIGTFDTSKYTPPTSPQSDHEPNAEVEECEVDAHQHGFGTGQREATGPTSQQFRVL